MAKMLLLGLDGATFEMLDPMIETGRLPVLQRLLRGEGVHGTLSSTVPPVTCPAWPTMYTGRNPGVHGITGFRIPRPGSLALRTVTLKDVPLPRLWTVLNAAGIRTGVFNVPATCPADPLDGFMVSGLPAPADPSVAIQPQRLREEFLKAFPRYDCNGTLEGPLFERRSKRKWIFETLERNLLQRKAALEWFLDREPVGFLWVVLEAIDRLSHSAYAFLSPQSGLYDTRHGRETRRRALALLERQDEVIGWILQRMGPDTPVMVVSDHGFAWTPKQFDICGWLIANDLLVPAAGLSLGKRIRFAARSAMFRSVIGQRIWHAMARLVRGVTRTEGQEHMAMAIDWKRTKAWSATFGHYGVWINSTKLHEKGVVTAEQYDEVADAVVDGLRSVEDLETGQRVFDVVVRRDEVYRGEHVEHAPDVLFVPSRNYHHRVFPIWRACPDKNLVTRAAELRVQSNHDSTGVFGAVGAPFCSRDVSGMRVLDVMPNVLYAMGLGVPSDLEGRVIEGMFSEEYRSMHPLQRVGEVAGPPPGAGEGEGYSPQEEDEISKRLKSLGYM